MMTANAVFESNAGLPQDVQLYFDYNATTPICQVALDAMSQASLAFANPSSRYKRSAHGRQILSTARQQLASLLGVQAQEIVFTSGGTEANNWAIQSVVYAALARSVRAQAAPPHLVVSAIEHASVLEVCRHFHEHWGCALSLVRPNAQGVLLPEVVQAALTPNTCLVAVMWVNNELGSIQPIASIAKLLRTYPHGTQPIHLHVDGVQGVGKLAVPVSGLGADSVSLSAHKFYAPKGIGALYLRQGVALQPMLHGGGQEGGARGGTESLGLIAAMGAAAQWVHAQLPSLHAMHVELRQLLLNGLAQRLPNARVHGPVDPAQCAPNTVNVCLPGVRAEALAALLDELHGIQVSLGSACSNNKSTQLSHVLQAIGLNQEDIQASMRISLGWHTQKTDIEALLDALVVRVGHLRRIQEGQVYAA